MIEIVMIGRLCSCKMNATATAGIVEKIFGGLHGRWSTFEEMECSICGMEL